MRTNNKRITKAQRREIVIVRRAGRLITEDRTIQRVRTATEQAHKRVLSPVQ